jgi:membrane associated rhomboid family serine protease
MTVLLIIFNVAFFAISSMGGAEHYVQVIFTYGLIPAELLRGSVVTSFPKDILAQGIHQVELKQVAPWITMFTSMFLHGGLWHLIGNMWFLWLFGDNVEDRMGPLGFLVFYILAGLFSGIAHSLVASSSLLPAIGASGAISGVMGAYFFLFPRANIQTVWFFFIFPQIFYIPAVFFLGIWFLGQVLSGVMTIGLQGAGIAFFAHIGGFVFGLFLVHLFARKRYIVEEAQYEPWRDFNSEKRDDMWY